MDNLGNLAFRHETYVKLADHNNVIRLRIEDHVEDHWSYYDLDNYNGVPTDVPTSVQYRNLKSVSPYRWSAQMVKDEAKEIISGLS